MSRGGGNRIVLIDNIKIKADPAVAVDVTLPQKFYVAVVRRPSVS